MKKKAFIKAIPLQVLKPTFKGLVVGSFIGAALFIMSIGDVKAAADIVRGTGCFFFDANGKEHFDPSANSQIIFTNNPKGNAIFRCDGHLPDGAPAPSRAMRFNHSNTGFECLGIDDWTMVVTPSGRGSVTCHIPE